MIGDRLLITDKAKQNAKNIFDHLKDEQIILIYGNSGTQKSEIADCLQELIFKEKYQSIVLSLDDFYLVHPTIRNFNRKKLGIDSVGLSEIDWEELLRIANDFLAKKPIRIRRTHKYADIVEHVTLDTEDITFLIIEGLYAGHLRKWNAGDFAVYLEGSPNQTLEFRKQRGKEDENDDFRKSVVAKEFNVVCQLKRYADLVIPYNTEE